MTWYDFIFKYMQADETQRKQILIHIKSATMCYKWADDIQENFWMKAFQKVS